MANIGLLIAGGSGNRMNQDIPKQFNMKMGLMYQENLLVRAMKQ